VELPGPLVDARWLAERLQDPDLVVADVRWYPDGSARRRYEEGHLPGAVFVDVDTDLSGPRGPGSGRHPLPSPEAFAEAMARLGVDDRTPVVAYDDTGGAYAARLWWMLRATGRRAAVLDGGLAAWDGPFETGPPPVRPRATFTPRPWPPELVARAEDVERARQDPEALVLDARAPERYRGEVEPLDPVAGHIPGARNAPYAANLHPSTGRFRPPEELRRRYRALGVGRAREVVVYCGSGVTACHDLLALEVAGLPLARLYPGSWSEWVADPSRPVATGDEP
jgi:thiosulfate/3-mercaptopyruvate sulfurtransferase